ncbi:hypothetical protein EniyanLRS_53 [Mycobacterium phage EniyanLRS]|uniref:Uncharacterized protein n=1 Tax=Mycobacterium phage EniyanLRS TaxID=1933770 RepID=A0A2I2MPF5_9CAUD|nr:hypothetical protein EniyanLRS_53 [Mycobacterium phage EniyanLRS]
MSELINPDLESEIADFALGTYEAARVAAHMGDQKVAGVLFGTARVLNLIVAGANVIEAIEAVEAGHEACMAILQRGAEKLAQREASGLDDELRKLLNDE